MIRRPRRDLRELLASEAPHLQAVRQPAPSWQASLPPGTLGLELVRGREWHKLASWVHLDGTLGIAPVPAQRDALKAVHLSST